MLIKPARLTDAQSQSEARPSSATPSAAATGREDAQRQLVIQVRDRVVAELRSHGDISDQEAIRRKIAEVYGDVIRESNLVLGRNDREMLFERIIAEILGYGPLDVLLRDDSITEIMVNGPDKVYIERKGKIELSPYTFDSAAHVMRINERIVGPLGRRVDESSPMVDARLPDGSRVNVIIPPLSLVGPVVTIRKFARVPLGVEDLIRYGTCSPEFIEFVKGCVLAKLNIVVSGGTGSGKTTLLSALAGTIPPSHRILLCEDPSEIFVDHPQLVRLEGRPPTAEGKYEVTMGSLVTSAMRMTPKWLVVGEIRVGTAALWLFRAQMSDHPGLSTIHSESPETAVDTVCLLAQMTEERVPFAATKLLFTRAIDLIVQIGRPADGPRRVEQIVQVEPALHEGEVVLTPLWQFDGTRDVPHWQRLNDLTRRRR